MIYSVQQIKFEILAYIKEFDTDFSNWYIGISSTPKVVMREAHGVDEAHDAWFCKQAVSFRACETIRSYFTEKLKVDGTRITGTADDGNWVYLFRKSSRRAACGSLFGQLVKGLGKIEALKPQIQHGIPAIRNQTNPAQLKAMMQ
jgi:hypothetical protein